MTKSNNLQIQKSRSLHEGIKSYFTFDRILILLITFGVILRIATYWTGVVHGDGSLYAALGNGLVQHHNFVVLPWENQPLYDFPLTYPAYLAGFYLTFGFNISTTKIAAIVMSVLILPIIYLATRDLLGHQKALVVTAVIALSEGLIITTAGNCTENMLILFMVPMIWSIIKGFEEDKYIPLVGLFGGLTYITKQVPGVTIVVAGMIAFILWRFYYMKWSIFKNRNYLLAGTIFCVFVFTRVMLMQTGGVMRTVSATEGYALFTTTRGLFEFIMQVPLHLILPALFFIFWIPELKIAFCKRKQEYYSFLWLIVIGVMLLALLHAAGRQTGLATLSAASARYFTLAYVPLLWLLLKDADFNIKEPDMKTTFEYMDFLKYKKKLCVVLFAILITGTISILIDLWWGIILFIGIFAMFAKNAKKRVGLMLIALLIVSSSTLIINEQFERPKEFIASMEDVSTYAHDGDVFAIDRYRIAPLHVMRASLYISKPEVTVIEYYEGCNATYILSQTMDNVSYQNYTMAKIYEDNSQLNIREKIYTQLKRQFIDKNFNYSTRTPIKLWKNKP